MLFNRDHCSCNVSALDFLQSDLPILTSDLNISLPTHCCSQIITTFGDHSLCALVTLRDKIRAVGVPEGPSSPCSRHNAALRFAPTARRSLHIYLQRTRQSNSEEAALGCASHKRRTRSIFSNVAPGSRRATQIRSDHPPPNRKLNTQRLVHFKTTQHNRVHGLPTVYLIIFWTLQGLY